MGDVLFNRAARLRIGQANSKTKPSGFKAGTDVLVFDGLKIAFNAEKSSEANANTAQIQIWNLRTSSRSFAEQLPLYVVLEVGYRPPNAQEVLSILFEGGITSTKGLDKKSVNKSGKVTNERQGPDWVTTFELGDGEAALQNSNIDKTFEKGVDVKTVINDVVESLGQTVGVIKGVANKVFNNGLTVSGASKDILAQITKDAGVEFNIQNGAVQILAPNATTGEEQVLISPQTGLINVPVKREEGIEFTSLIQPSVYPGRKVFLQSRDITGSFKVRKTNFNGDTHDGNWLMKIEAVEVEE